MTGKALFKRPSDTFSGKVMMDINKNCLKKEAVSLCILK